MDATAAKDPQLLRHFEGLVLKTAAICKRSAEEDFDDIAQFLRVKVWKALASFDPANLKVKPTSRKELEKARDKYVFSCLMNAKVDVLKKKRHRLLFIEDITLQQSSGAEEQMEQWVQRDRFEGRYLCTEDAYQEVEEELPLIPSTLTTTEKAVLGLLYVGYKPAEIAAEVGILRCEVSSATKAIRQKMADWNPGPLDQPLPVAA